MIDASSFDSEGPSGSLFALTLSLSPPLQTPLASCSRSDLIYLWLNCYARWEFNCARRRWKGDGLWVVLDLLSKLIGGNLDTTFQLSYESTICKIETNKNPFLLNYYLENHASKESNPDQRYLLVPLGWSKTKNRSQGVFCPSLFFLLSFPFLSRFVGVAGNQKLRDSVNRRWNGI